MTIALRGWTSWDVSCNLGSRDTRALPNAAMVPDVALVSPRCDHASCKSRAGGTEGKAPGAFLALVHSFTFPPSWSVKVGLHEDACTAARPSQGADTGSAQSDLFGELQLR